MATTCRLQFDACNIGLLYCRSYRFTTAMHCACDDSSYEEWITCAVSCVHNHRDDYRTTTIRNLCVWTCCPIMSRIGDHLIWQICSGHHWLWWGRCKCAYEPLLSDSTLTELQYCQYHYIGAALVKATFSASMSLLLLLLNRWASCCRCYCFIGVVEQPHTSCCLSPSLQTDNNWSTQYCCDQSGSAD